MFQAAGSEQQLRPRQVEVMAVRAELDGHPFDLNSLARLYPHGDPKIVVVEKAAYLESSTLDGYFSDGGSMMKMTDQQLARLNGYAMLRDPGFRRVRLSGHFLNDSGTTHTYVSVTDEAGGRDSVTIGTAEVRSVAHPITVLVDGVPVPPPTPDGPRFIAMSTSNKDLDDLLKLISTAESPGWDELWKALEIIKVAMGGEKALVATGLDHSPGVHGAVPVPPW